MRTCFKGSTLHWVINATAEWYEGFKWKNEADIQEQCSLRAHKVFWPCQMYFVVIHRFYDGSCQREATLQSSYPLQVSPLIQCRTFELLGKLSGFWNTWIHLTKCWDHTNWWVESGQVHLNPCQQPWWLKIKSLTGIQQCRSIKSTIPTFWLHNALRNSVLLILLVSSKHAASSTEVPC